MCGVHIIVDKRSQLNEKIIQQMLSSTHYRGPDSQGWIRIQSAQQTVWMANNRLKISDLRDDANQPMVTKDNRYTLVFNGAIYNDKQLRRDYLPETTFRTDSDTETVLQLFAKYNSTLFSKLNGMFALACYDKITETLTIVRDRWGMKPLYWFENESFLIISSEIRGILATGLVAKEPNLSQVPHYLSFRFSNSPQTFYKNIIEVETGALGISCPNQWLQITDHISIPERQSSLNGNTPSLQQLESLLEQTAYQYSNSDVSAGLFLSGGVDSTLLLASMYAMGMQSFPVFTIGYSASDKPYTTQDHQFARQAAQQYKADLHEVMITSKLLEQFPDWVQTMDQPVADGAAWLTYLLSQEARKHVKIVLSGAGADELFAGYNRHWAYYYYLKMPSLLKKAIPWFQKLPQSWLQKNHYGRLWQKALHQLQPSPEQTFIRFTAGATTFPWLDELSHQTSMDIQSDMTKEYFTENHLSAALRFDQSHYLASDVLTITDRMTMQHGIEARLPYLDDQIVAFAQAIPATSLLKNGKKWILKEILSKKNGQSYVQRRKEGFGMPLGHWLRTSDAENVFVNLQKRNSLVYEIIDYTFVHNLQKAHQKGSDDYTSELWSLSLLAAWLDKEF